MKLSIFKKYNKMSIIIYWKVCFFFVLRNKTHTTWRITASKQHQQTTNQPTNQPTYLPKILVNKIPTWQQSFSECSIVYDCSQSIIELGYKQRFEQHNEQTPTTNSKTHCSVPPDVMLRPVLEYQSSR
jgi:hypothetical protein